MTERTKSFFDLKPSDLFSPSTYSFVEGLPLEALKKINSDHPVKKARLKRLGDTYVGITWHDFIESAKAYGFKCGFRQKFTGSGLSEEKSFEEEEIIFFHEEKGLILYAESCEETSVGDVVVYGEVKADHRNEKQIKALEGSSNCGNRNGTWSFKFKLKDGLHLYLNAVSEAFEFSKTWRSPHYLLFLNYMDWKKHNSFDSDVDEITNQKIAACTPEVRKIIFG